MFLVSHYLGDLEPFLPLGESLKAEAVLQSHMQEIDRKKLKILIITNTLANFLSLATDRWRITLYYTILEVRIKQVPSIRKRAS